MTGEMTNRSHFPWLLRSMNVFTNKYCWVIKSRDAGMASIAITNFHNSPHSSNPLDSSNLRANHAHLSNNKMPQCPVRPVAAWLALIAIGAAAILLLLTTVAGIGGVKATPHPLPPEDRWQSRRSRALLEDRAARDLRRAAENAAREVERLVRMVRFLPSSSLVSCTHAG
jgi:hypothetical protein